MHCCAPYACIVRGERVQALQMERLQRERREREIRAMEREVDARSGGAQAAAVAAAEREALAQHHAARRDEDVDRRRVAGEVDDVLRAVGGPPNKALPSILTPLGSGKPPSRASSSSHRSGGLGGIVDHDDFGVPSSLDRATSEPASLGPSRVGGPVVRDVFAMPKGGGGSNVALHRAPARVSASPGSGAGGVSLASGGSVASRGGSSGSGSGSGSGAGAGEDERPMRGRRSASPSREVHDHDVAHVRYSSAQAADKFEHMSARDKVLARKQDERMRAEEQRKRDLAKAAQAAYADRAFAAAKEAEQYRGVEAAKASAFGGGAVVGGVSPRSRLIVGEAAGSDDRAMAAARLKLPGSRYDAVDDSHDEEPGGAYSEGVQYSLGGAGGGSGAGSKAGYHSRDRSPVAAARPSVPSGFVMPGSGDAGDEDDAYGGPVDGAFDVDTDDSDVPAVGGGDRAGAGAGKGILPPDDDDELDVVEEELRNELGEWRGCVSVTTVCTSVSPCQCARACVHVYVCVRVKGRCFVRVCVRYPVRYPFPSLHQRVRPCGAQTSGPTSRP
jgi:hypothetical protein